MTSLDWALLDTNQPVVQISKAAELLLNPQRNHQLLLTVLHWKREQPFVSKKKRNVLLSYSVLTNLPIYSMCRMPDNNILTVITQKHRSIQLFRHNKMMMMMAKNIFSLFIYDYIFHALLAGASGLISKTFFKKSMKTAELALNHNDPLMNKVPKICFALAGSDIMLHLKAMPFSLTLCGKVST